MQGTKQAKTRGKALERGYTLLELMATLAIGGVLMGVGVPSFNNVIENTRTTTVANRLLADFARVRSEAITARSGAVLCPSADSLHCDISPDFSRGWIGFRDRNSNGRMDNGDEVILVSQESDLGRRRVATTAGRRQFQFRSDGRSGGTNLTIRVCNAEGVAQRLVVLNVGGRARVARATSSTPPCPG